MIIEAQFICILMSYSKIAQEKDNTNVLKYGTKCVENEYTPYVNCFNIVHYVV